MDEQEQAVLNALVKFQEELAKVEDQEKFKVMVASLLLGAAGGMYAREEGIELDTKNLRVEDIPLFKKSVFMIKQDGFVLEITMRIIDSVAEEQSKPTVQ